MSSSATAQTASANMKDDCTALSIAFANAVDHRDYARALSVFTPDGVFERWDKTFKGIDEIAAMLDARPVDMLVRHFCTNIEITPCGDNAATGTTYFMFFREMGDPSGSLPISGPKMIGEYLDQFRLTDAGWRIARRSVKLVFHEAPASA